MKLDEAFSQLLDDYNDHTTRRDLRHIYYKLQSYLKDKIDHDSNFKEEMLENMIEYLNSGVTHPDFRPLERNLAQITSLFTTIDEISPVNFTRYSNSLLDVCKRLLSFTKEEQHGEHMFAFHYLLYALRKIEDNRFIDHVEKYILLLNEDYFLGEVGEEIFMYCYEHRGNQELKAMIMRNQKNKVDRLDFYLESALETMK